MARGAQALADGELLAILLRTGRKGELVAGINYCLEEQVGLLQLIPEEAIVLAELEVAEIPFVDRCGTEYIEAGEQPAASTGLLVGDALGLHPVAELGVDHRSVLRIDGQGIDGSGSR